MTGSPSAGWKIFADGDEADDVPLWQVLAQFRADDLDEGLKENAAIINQARPFFARYYNIAFVVSFAFGFQYVLLLIGRSEEQKYEIQSLLRILYAVFFLK